MSNSGSQNANTVGQITTNGAGTTWSWTPGLQQQQSLYPPQQLPSSPSTPDKDPFDEWVKTVRIAHRKRIVQISVAAGIILGVLLAVGGALMATWTMSGIPLSGRVVATGAFVAVTSLTGGLWIQSLKPWLWGYEEFEWSCRNCGLKHKVSNEQI